MIFANQFQQTFEQRNEARLGKNAGNHLNTLLRRIDLRVHRRLRRRLQHIAIHRRTLRGRANTLRFNLIQVIQYRHRRLADERSVQLLDHTRRTGADNRAVFVIQNIVEIHLPFDDAQTRVDALCQAIKNTTHHVRFDLLQIHHALGDRLAINRVRLGVGANHRKRRFVHNLILQHITSLANRTHTMQLSDAVAVLIDADIKIVKLNALHRLIDGIIRPIQAGVALLLFQQPIPAIVCTGIAMLTNFLLIETHLDKLRNRTHRARADNIGRLNRHSTAVDDKLLGRNTPHTITAVFVAQLNFATEKPRLIGHRHNRTKHRIRISLLKCRNLHFGQTRKLASDNLLVILGIPSHNAELLNQRILKP